MSMEVKFAAFGEFSHHNLLAAGILRHNNDLFEQFPRFFVNQGVVTFDDRAFLGIDYYHVE